MQQILSGMPDTSSIFAERVSQGFYLNVEVNRPEAARYGLTVADVQRVITSEIGGASIAQNVEGRRAFPIAVRYERDFRDNPEELGRALVGTPSGAQIPISQVARTYFSRGPAMIRDEDGALTGYVYLDLNTKDYGGFVGRADRLLKAKLDLAGGYTYRWAGEYEFELRAKERLKIILPVVFFVIFLLLYIVFKSATEAAVLIFPTLYAMSGGLLLQWALGYNFSVAVWVGYIALFGIAVETGVVMVVYLHEALQHRLAEGKPLTDADVEQATIDGAVQRLRPKLMTVTAVILSLAPILWESGHRVGCDEADRRSNCRRNDHVHHSRADSRPSVFLAHQTTGITPGQARRTAELKDDFDVMCSPGQKVASLAPTDPAQSYENRFAVRHTYSFRFLPALTPFRKSKRGV